MNFRDMKCFLALVRAARETLALPAFSADAEWIYCDSLMPITPDAATQALRTWLRQADRFPLPHELRDIAAQLAGAKAEA